MIFSPVDTVKNPFTAAVLDAINIFSEFTSSTLSDLNKGVGCNINEFNINKTLLDISKYLMYTYHASLSIEELSGYVAALSSDEIDPSDDDVICGAHLLYLVLAQNNEGILESISDEAYPHYQQILSRLQEILN